MPAQVPAAAGLQHAYELPTRNRAFTQACQCMRPYFQLALLFISSSNNPVYRVPCSEQADS